jgi:hypothetical protein
MPSGPTPSGRGATGSPASTARGCEAPRAIEAADDTDTHDGIDTDDGKDTDDGTDTDDRTDSDDDTDTDDGTDTNHRTRDDTRPGGDMAQYAVMIFERETAGGAADLPPEVIEEHIALPDRVAGLGGRIVAGLALEPSGTATAIRGREVVTDGPFIESKEAIAGVFVLEARDLDHALALAKLTPIVDGGGEVRPLVDFQVGES